MKPLDSKTRKIVLAACILFMWLLFSFLSWYDRLRMADISLMSNVRVLHTTLEEYYRNHAAYPPSQSGTDIVYQPLNQDGSQCNSTTSCPWYQLQFTLSTSTLLKRGIHFQTPTELK